MKLSVVVCTYNGAKYISEQIKSILFQTVPVNEIVICDDGSSDDTVELAKRELDASSFRDYKILVDRSHHGVSANFLRGMKASTGDYVFCCDQDDVWCDNKVELFVEAANRTHMDLYFSDGYVVDSDLTKRDYSLWDSISFSYGMAAERPLFEILLQKNVVTGAAMLVSRRLIDGVDCIPNGWLHDGWFAMAAAAKGSIEPINHKTFLYRQHDANAVGARSNSLVEKVRRWSKGIPEQPEVRSLRLERYTSARDMLGIKGEAIEDCLYFWNKLDGLTASGFVRGFGTILRLLANGSYSRYYTGTRGGVRDLAWLLIR